MMMRVKMRNFFCKLSRLKEKETLQALYSTISSSSSSSDLTLRTRSIISLCKKSDLVAARKVFDEMPERSVVSWTAMISGYSQSGCSHEALSLFALMRRSCFVPNQFTYGTTLRACTMMGGAVAVIIGEQIQGCIEKSIFSEDIFVQSALLDLHFKCGRSVEDARSLFDRMERRDVVCWNSVIGGYEVRGLRDDAFRLFCSMIRDGLLPDHFTFASVLKACSSSKDLCINVDQINAFVIKLGYGDHHVVCGSLIDAYAKCRRMHSARLVYDSMLKHDLVSCTSLINGYSLEKCSDKKALDVFCEINRMGMAFDEVIICSVLNICANAASLSLGRQIHACVIKNRPICDIALGNALIDMYAKTGELEDAHQAFDEMRHRDVVSWTSLITTYGQHGHGETAIALFAKMENDGVKPNDVTFLSLLFACSHSGLTTKGIDLFNLMVSKYDIHPRAEHYSCIVDLLARGGLLKEAYGLACNMDVKHNKSLWGSLLGACSIHGNTSLGRIIAAHVFDIYPEISANYVVLANIYAAAGLWEDAQKARKLIDERSVKKIAGCSFI